MALGVDESYYWTYSQNLKWNYFDHPPMVAIWIRLSTANLLLESIEGFVRLGSVLGCAVSSWFIYKTCEVLHSQKAGFVAACLYSASFYAAVTAGLFIMPDSPQMVFFTLCLYLIALITTKEQNWTYWLAFGIAAGLCIMSKVHGVFIWVGLGSYILFSKRTWLKLPQLYSALLVSILIALPILIWNIQNNFITYKFHSKRVVINEDPLNFIAFFGEMISQFLYNNPFNVLCILIAIAAYIKQRRLKLPALTIFNFIGFPLALLLLMISLFKNTALPHWSGPAYVALIPLAAIHLASNNITLLRGLAKASVYSFIIILLAGKIALHFYPHHFGVDISTETLVAKNKSFFQKSLQVFDGFAKMQLVAEPLDGWDEAKKQFNTIYKNEVENHTIAPASPVVCSDWRAAQVEYYFCRKNEKQMIGLGGIEDLHEYAWTNKMRTDKVDMANALLIAPADDVDAEDGFSAYYENVDSITTILIDRAFRPDLQFNIYRLSGWRNNLPAF
jgi:hypothetical protein